MVRAVTGWPFTRTRNRRTPAPTSDADGAIVWSPRLVRESRRLPPTSRRGDALSTRRNAILFTLTEEASPERQPAGRRQRRRAAKPRTWEPDHAKRRAAAPG